MHFDFFFIMKTRCFNLILNNYLHRAVLILFLLVFLLVGSEKMPFITICHVPILQMPQ